MFDPIEIVNQLTAQPAIRPLAPHHTGQANAQRFGSASSQLATEAGDVLVKAAPEVAEATVKNVSRWSQGLQGGLQRLKDNIIGNAFLAAPFALIPFSPIHLGVGSVIGFYGLSLASEFIQGAFFGAFKALKPENLLKAVKTLLA